MAEQEKQERLFAAIRCATGGIYVTSFADKEELDKKLASEQGKIELIESSTDYDKILKVMEDDPTPSLMERVVEQSTNKNGQLNLNTLLWFLKKTK